MNPNATLPERIEEIQRELVGLDAKDRTRAQLSSLHESVARRHYLLALLEGMRLALSAPAEQQAKAREVLGV